MTILDTRTIPTDLLLHVAEQLSNTHERLLRAMDEINTKYRTAPVLVTIRTKEELETRIRWMSRQ